MSKTIIVEILVDSSIQKVWETWNGETHILNWYFASPEWECPSAEVNLKIGGQMIITLAAKDQSMSFDLTGEYTNIEESKLIEYKLEDGRDVSISFEETPNGIKITETFEAEESNPVEMQKQGWQSILNNFKTYAETL